MPDISADILSRLCKSCWNEGIKTAKNFSSLALLFFPLNGFEGIWMDWMAHATLDVDGRHVGKMLKQAGRCNIWGRVTLF